MPVYSDTVLESLPIGQWNSTFPKDSGFNSKCELQFLKVH